MGEWRVFAFGECSKVVKGRNRGAPYDGHGESA